MKYAQQQRQLTAQFSRFTIGAPPAINSGDQEAKIRTASWENVNKQMLHNMKLHMSMFQMT